MDTESGSLKSQRDGGRKMTTILICGKKEESSVTRALVHAAGKYGEIQTYANGKLYGGKKPEFLLYDFEQLPEIQMPQGILVFKDSFSGRIPCKIPGGFLAVFSACNKAAASALGGTGISAVTCGTAARDTISAASLGFPQSVVSLQRSVRTLAGTVLEPHDIPVTLSEPYTLGPLLIASAVLLIAGVFSGNGYEF